MVIATTPRTVGGALGARKVQRQIGQRGNGSGLEEGTVMCSPSGPCVDSKVACWAQGNDVARCPPPLCVLGMLGVQEVLSCPHI